MTSTSGTGRRRLVRPELSPNARHLSAATILTTIGLLAVVGLATAPIAFLAAGAGAGYSLSGSV